VTGQWAFIPVIRAVDNRTIYYIKVPSCVVYVDCPDYRCGAKAGQRCNGALGPTTGVHSGRKSMGRALLERNPDLKIQNCGPVLIGR